MWWPARRSSVTPFRWSLAIDRLNTVAVQHFSWIIYLSMTKRCVFVIAFHQNAFHCLWNADNLLIGVTTRRQTTPIAVMALPRRRYVPRSQAFSLGAKSCWYQTVRNRLCASRSPPSATVTVKTDPNTWSPSVPRQPPIVFTMPPHTTRLLILTHGDAVDPIPSAVQQGHSPRRHRIHRLCRCHAPSRGNFGLAASVQAWKTRASLRTRGSAETAEQRRQPWRRVCTG